MVTRTNAKFHFNRLILTLIIGIQATEPSPGLIKSGIVTFGETKCQHFISMNKHRWVLGSETVEEFCEYKNIGVLKNYVGSFSSNVINNIEKNS